MTTVYTVKSYSLCLQGLCGTHARAWLHTWKLHMEDKSRICYLELKRGKRSGEQCVGGDVIFAEGMNTI